MDRIIRLLCPLALIFAFASCSGNIYERQASIYNDYRPRIDTAATYQSLKSVNDALEAEMAALLKKNAGEVLSVSKEARQNRDSEKRLAKAESEYMNAYLGKFFSMNLQEQIGLYEEYTRKIAQVSGYEGLSALHRSLNGAVANATSKYSAEYKKAGAKKIMPETFATLEKAKETFLAAYAAKVAPLLYAHETALYGTYRTRLDAAGDYKQMKQVRLYLAKEIAILNSENAAVYSKLPQDAYAAEKAAAAAARDAFQEYYMEKVALPLIGYQKQLYNGAAEMLSAAASAEEINIVNKSLVELNNAFVKENGDELKWIENAILSGNRIYVQANDELNACLNRAVDAAKERARELGLQ